MLPLVQGQVLPPRMPSMEWRLVCTLPAGHAAGSPASVWRPVGAPQYFCLGDVIRRGRDPPSEPVPVYRKAPLAAGSSDSDGTVFAFPEHFNVVWRELSGRGVSLWRAQPPRGYRVLGCIATRGLDPPSKTSCVCVREVCNPCIGSTVVQPCVKQPAAQESLRWACRQIWQPSRILF